MQWNTIRCRTAKMAHKPDKAAYSITVPPQHNCMMMWTTAIMKRTMMWIATKTICSNMTGNPKLSQFILRQPLINATNNHRGVRGIRVAQKIRTAIAFTSNTMAKPATPINNQAILLAIEYTQYAPPSGERRVRLRAFSNAKCPHAAIALVVRADQK